MKGSHKLMIAGLIAAGATSATLYFSNPFVGRRPEWTPLYEVQPRAEQQKRINARLDDLTFYKPRVRAEAARELGFEGNFNSVPALINALKDESRGVRIEAAGSLGRIGDKRAVMPLIEALNTKDNVEFKEYSYRGRASFMDEAAAALGNLKDPMAAPYLINLLLDPNYTSFTIGNALQQISDSKSVSYLLDALKHSDKKVRENAIFALRGFKDETIVERLLVVLKDEKEDLIKGVSAELLADFKDERVVPALIEAAGYTSGFAKAQVLEALGKIGDDRAIPVLAESLNDEDSFVRERAWAAIGDFATNNQGNFKVFFLLEALQKADLCGKKEDMGSPYMFERSRAWNNVRAALSPGTVEALKNENAVLDAEAEYPSDSKEDPWAAAGLIGKLYDADEITRGEAAEKLGDLGEPSAVPHLLGLLGDKSAFVRFCTCYALGNIRDERAVPGLAKSLSDTDIVSAHASWGLARMGSISIPALAKLLESNEYVTHFRTARTLGEIGDSKALPYLTRFIKEKISEAKANGKRPLTQHYDPKVPFSEIEHAVEAIGKIGDPAAVPDLIELSYESGGVSDLLLEAFKRIGEPAVPYLAAALNDRRTEVRRSAAFLLGELGSKSATVPLIRHLDEKDDTAMFHIVSALGKIRDSTATPGLIRLIEKGRPPAADAAQALGEIGDPAAIPALERSLRSYGGWSTITPLGMASFKALGKIGGPAIPILIEALNSEDSDAKARAAEALGVSGDKRATIPLINALDDDDRGVRYCVCEALGKIKDRRAVLPLVELLGNKETQIIAAETLGKIGDDSALPALAEMARDKDYYVSNVAYAAINSIKEIHSAREN